MASAWTRHAAPWRDRGSLLLTCMAERRPVEQIDPGAARGGLRYWQINAKPVFDSTGDFIGYRGFGRDVTVHRQTARHLIRAKEEAEKAGQVAFPGDDEP